MDHNYSPFNPYNSNYSSNSNPQYHQQQQQQQSQQPQPSSSTRPYIEPVQPPLSLTDSSFDILDWHPAYQSCQRYFLDHAQHDPGTQAVCALINIRLPCQWLVSPVTSSGSAAQSSGGGGGGGGGSGGRSSSHSAQAGSSSNPPPFTFSGGSRPSSHTRPPPPPTFISPIPYIRRLIVTGFDKPPILHGFFGDDYVKGILPHVECERRNYLFAAKSGGWRSCKRQYDSGSGGGGFEAGEETVPFMKPLREVPAEEVRAAEGDWSRWLGMEDWMVGDGDGMSGDGEGGRVKLEGREGGARGGHLEREEGRREGGMEEGFGGGGGMEGHRSH